MLKIYGALIGVIGFSVFCIVGGFALKGFVADKMDAEESKPVVIYNGAVGANGETVQNKDSLPAVDCNEWNLRLVNKSNPLPEDFSISLVDIGNNKQIDSRCSPDLERMLSDCRAAGCNPLICSAYRTQECQKDLFDREVTKFMNQGFSYDDAYCLAAEGVAIPGTSEHQLGLAVDIVDKGNQNLNDEQANTPTQRWLYENSWRYGFILRYGADKTEITGYKYEPWHYRYVGLEAAQFIYEHGICLEEYLGVCTDAPEVKAPENGQYGYNSSNTDTRFGEYYGDYSSGKIYTNDSSSSDTKNDTMSDRDVFTSDDYDSAEFYSVEKG